eukprot:snap_masked-scaffold_9-processed-gene-11.40-mRNA-1 protein AED:1.00 eAED:1.00 QI:0/0/0/0/1/1/2/0/96
MVDAAFSLYHVDRIVKLIRGKTRKRIEKRFFRKRYKKNYKYNDQFCSNITSLCFTLVNPPKSLRTDLLPLQQKVVPDLKCVLQQILRTTLSAVTKN